jgi:hypothetical protein
VLGLAVAIVAASERLTVTVAPDRVTLARIRQPNRKLELPAVGAVYLDGKDLVIEDHEGVELARDSDDLDEPALREAFVAHGYPWRDTHLTRDGNRPGG